MDNGYSGIFINPDPCGLLCFLFVYFVIFYSDYAFIYWIIIDSEFDLLKTLNICCYQIAFSLLIWSHLKASLTNPGHVLRSDPNDDSAFENLLKSNKEFNLRVCKKCKAYRPPKSYHCRICQKCIYKMHHHCPWINNCVGQVNQKFFIQFLFYLLLICVYTIVVIIIELISNRNTSQAKAIHTFILLIESLLFGIFAIVVFSDQVYSVIKSTPSSKSLSPQLFITKLCGTEKWLLWILPFKQDDQNYKQLVV